MEMKHLQSLIKRNSNEINFVEYDIGSFKYHARICKEYDTADSVNWNELHRLKVKAGKLTELQKALKEELRHAVGQQRFNKNVGALLRSVKGEME